jgi:Leucine-rich repeat (LRR) protein
MELARKKISECSGPSLSLSSLSLEANALSSLVPIMASKGISALILRDNSLTNLPQSIADLSTLTTLDLSSNPIANIVDMANVASSIPNLRALSVDVDEEEVSEGHPGC